jgi:hypothetical protein
MHALLDALDRPAHQAVHLRDRPLWITIATGLAGAILIGLASTAALALDSLHFGERILPRIDVLRALFEALLVVAPSAILLSAYFQIAISPRIVLAAIALGLLIAGIVVASALPLVTYLTLLAAKPAIAPGVLLPFVALAAAAATSTRILRAIDPSRRARIFAFGFQVALAMVFFARFQK